MKRTLFQWFNLLMACVVLLSSTGFGLVEHSCQMRGKKKTMVVAFSDVKPKGCEAGQPAMPTVQTVLKKTECCQDDQHYKNVDISSSLSQFVAKLIKSISQSVLAGVSAVLVWLCDWIFAEKAQSVPTFASPPSLSGRDILTLIRTLLI